jgi:hypothetical protein
MRTKGAESDRWCCAGGAMGKNTRMDREAVGEIRFFRCEKQWAPWWLLRVLLMWGGAPLEIV